MLIFKEDIVLAVYVFSGLLFCNYFCRYLGKGKYKT